MFQVTKKNPFLLPHRRCLGDAAISTDITASRGPIKFQKLDATRMVRDLPGIGILSTPVLLHQNISCAPRQRISPLWYETAKLSLPLCHSETPNSFATYSAGAARGQTVHSGRSDIRNEEGKLIRLLQRRPGNKGKKKERVAFDKKIYKWEHFLGGLNSAHASSGSAGFKHIILRPAAPRQMTSRKISSPSSVSVKYHAITTRIPMATAPIYYH